jgi:ferric iron reductase protein FhuF
MRSSQENLLIEEGMDIGFLVDVDRPMYGTRDCLFKKCCKKYKKKGKKKCKSCPKR